MKKFSDIFKLYAYKQHDRCDVSIMVSETLVMTFRLTHSEIKRLFDEYQYIDPNTHDHGVRFKSENGPHWFAMDKKHLKAIRITIGHHGADFNFRVSYNDWDLLKLTYEQQMSTEQDWDNK
jgi:hypothetical protein